MLVQVIGAIFAGISGLLATWAVVQSRRTEGKTATREEIKQALDAQTALLDRYEDKIDGSDSKIAGLEAKNTALEARVEDAIAVRIEAQHQHRECERRLQDVSQRLDTAEAKIKEISGD